MANAPEISYGEDDVLRIADGDTVYAFTCDAAVDLRADVYRDGRYVGTLDCRDELGRELRRVLAGQGIPLQVSAAAAGALWMYCASRSMGDSAEWARDVARIGGLHGLLDAQAGQRAGRGKRKAAKRNTQGGDIRPVER